MKQQAQRRGFSLIELQVAMIVFAIGVVGIGPLVVMQTRSLERIESRFNSKNTYYLVPSTDTWAQKLGATARLTTVDPGPPAAAPVLKRDDADEEFITVGTGWTAEANPEAYQGGAHVHEAGDGSEIARWEFTGLAPGWYNVQITWKEDDLLADDAPYTILEGTETKATKVIDQTTAPAGDEFDGKLWESLGIVSTTTGSMTVELTDGGSDRVVADAVRLVPVQNGVRINSLDKSLTSEEVTAHVTVTEVVPPE